MAELSLGSDVSLEEATDMVQHIGANLTFIFQGEMGIGKSWMLKALKERLPDHRAIYAETQTFDTSDLTGVPFVELVNGVKVTRFAPNILTGVGSDQPVIFMADEIGKAIRPVQNSFLRLFQERRIGEHALPEGSMVFGTTNLATEGLQDHVQQHAVNRVSFATVRKPNAEKWLPWGMRNNIHPIVLAWVKKFPHCLASFKDGDNNPYISYPGKTVGPFVSPRSLESASHILWKRDNVGENATMAGLRGCVGNTAAFDLLTFAQTYDRLAAWESIVKTPKTALVPADTDYAANYVTVFSAITLVDRGSFDPFMEYVARLPKEYQGLFALNVLASPKRDIATSNRKFITWATKNEYLV